MEIIYTMHIINTMNWIVIIKMLDCEAHQLQYKVHH